MSKITHDYKCKDCGKPATINLQQNWQKYSIKPNGDTELEKEWEGDDNEFYCDNCAEEEGI
jgi:hypothetical protein